MCCRVSPCAAVCGSQRSSNPGLFSRNFGVLQCVVVRCVAVCRNVLQCVAVCCRDLPCVAVCCRALHGVAVCCSQWKLRLLPRARLLRNLIVWHDSFIEDVIHSCVCVHKLHVCMHVCVCVHVCERQSEHESESKSKHESESERTSERESARERVSLSRSLALTLSERVLKSERKCFSRARGCSRSSREREKEFLTPVARLINLLR